MKRMRTLTLVLALAFAVPALAQENKKKIYQGFDGGMMVHTGYLSGVLDPLGYEAKGAPLGIGGAIHIHLGDHFRVGGEGYVSSLSQLGNGSYLQYGWGGLLADWYTVLGRFQPYVGLTLGGGAMTTLLMTQTPAAPWQPVDGSYYHKQAFMAITPFLGCDFILTKAIHLTLKVDYLCALSRGKLLPHGPRIYFGFLFYR
ncbi:MAG: hypothetical protein J6Y32_07845 [Bacteroidales bacterium]|nr:hypothetical protein [Bacteroidales bacterium]